MSFEKSQKDATRFTEAQILTKEKELLSEYRVALRRTRARVSLAYSSLLSSVGTDQYYNELIKFDRLTKLESDIGGIFKDLGTGGKTAIRQASEIGIANEYYRKQFSVQWVAPYRTTFIPELAILSSVTGSEEAWKRLLGPQKGRSARNKKFSPIRPSSGATLTELWRNNITSGLKRINQTVRQGLLLGHGFNEMSRNLRASMQISAGSALRIMRTESHRNIGSGDYLQFQDARERGIASERQLLSVLDSRTRRQSAQVDLRKDTGEGFLYPDGNRYFVPGNTGNPAWDINDRETTITLVDGVEPSVRRARNPVTGKNEVISFKPFGDWLKDNGLKFNSYGKIIKT